jgi:ribosomal protein S18 acetylase RimI-like enzyme
MTSELLIRRAEPGDLAGIAHLAGELVRMHHAVNPDRFVLPDDVEKGYAWWLGKETAREQAVVLAALQGSALVGYAYGALEGRDWNMLLDDHGAIHDIFVDASARRAGVGRALLQEMIARLEHLGAKRIVLSTMVDNDRAQRLFRACGFLPTMLEMTRMRAGPES